jgi:hypothetical protein
MAITNFTPGEVLDVNRLNSLISEVEANTAPEVMSKISDKVGSIRQSVLDQAEFNNENPGLWLLMNGQTCSGTEYNTLTGSTTVPNLTSDGAFLRQAKSGRAQGSYEDMDWKGFYQMNTGQNTPSYNHNSEYHGKSTSSFVGRTFAGYWAANSAATGTKWDTSEIRPKNVACNHFIKVGY